MVVGMADMPCCPDPLEVSTVFDVPCVIVWEGVVPGEMK